MPVLPVEMMKFLSVFSVAFTKRTWSNMQVLLIGSLLCQGPRRISSILRVMGLGESPSFSKYHRVFNRAKWNSLALSKILLGKMLPYLPKSMPIIIVVDETIERRKGKKISAKGCYRDAVRSSHSTVITCYGLKWECMTLMLTLPFCTRLWALPFMTVLAPSKSANEEAGKSHKTSIDWTIIMMKVVCRWLDRPWILIGDGAYACRCLAQACIQKKVALISRLRLDAQIYEFPEPHPVGKRGRKRIKGQRIDLKTMSKNPELAWQISEIKWYGGKTKTLHLLSAVCLWYQAGQVPIPLRYVLVVDPSGRHSPEVFFSTQVDMSMEEILEYYVLRWNIEVTFEETRAHLGMETQRQWSNKAIARTTPLLMGLYSLIVLWALKMKEAHKIIPLSTTWYRKGNEVTFSDILTFIRQRIWRETYFSKSVKLWGSVKIAKQDFNLLIYQLSLAA